MIYRIAFSIILGCLFSLTNAQIPDIPSPLIENESVFEIKQDIRTQVYLRKANSVWNRSIQLPKTSAVGGFFCKSECAADKNSKFTSRFRLGSVVYSEYMEGRKEYYLRNLQ